MDKRGTAVLGITALALVLGFLVLREKKGFTLKLVNAPEEAWKWYGSLGTAETSSGWLAIEETWNYPKDPQGQTLFISVIDEDLEQILFVDNLGPPENTKHYIFDCETKTLTMA